MRLYVASSWRNPYQQNAVALLREQGHEVYDFMHPPGGDHLGFSWQDTIDDPNSIPWTEWDVDRYLTALTHPVAQAGFDSDFGAMHWADAGVLLLPCGRSAHLEAGWIAGQGKPVWVVLDAAEFPAPGGSNPELMYKIATGIVRDLGELLAALEAHVATAVPA